MQKQHLFQLGSIYSGSCKAIKQATNELVGQYKWESKMGYRIVITTHNVEGLLKTFETQGMIQNNSSLTRSELMTLAVLLDIIPSKTEIEIYVDSTATISAVQNYYNPLKRKRRKIYKNLMLLLTINKLIKEKT